MIWEPMCTAPKDKTIVLAWWSCGEIAAIYWDENHGDWRESLTDDLAEGPDRWTKINVPD